MLPFVRSVVMRAVRLAPSRSRFVSSSGAVSQSAAGVDESTSASPSAARSPYLGIYSFPADRTPTKLADGRGWRRPRLSGRRAAEMRKSLLIAAGDGDEEAARVLSSTDWRQTPPMARVMLPPKGRAHDLRVAERVAKITAAIAPEVQAKRRAEHRKTLPAKLRAAGLLQHVKKSAWEKD